MPFRFHKTIKIAPGVKFNFNKKSASMSFGGKHAGFTISPSTGAHIRASAYGTGLSYRKKVGGQKKRRVNNGTAEQRRLLNDVRELEDALELLQAEEELDAALDAKMAPIGGNTRKEKTQAQEPCRPETSGAVRMDAIVGGIMSALGLGFLGWIFYNWVIVRYAIYGLILFRVGRCVWSIIKAETIAEENARHNMKLKNRSGRAEKILGS